MRASEKEQLSDYVVSLAVIGRGGLGRERRIARSIRIHRRMGSAALALAYVANGRFDAFVQNGGLSLWDVAAAGLIAERAGATVSDLYGGPWWDPLARGATISIVAAPPPHHAALLELLAALGTQVRAAGRAQPVSGVTQDAGEHGQRAGGGAPDQLALRAVAADAQRPARPLDDLVGDGALVQQLAQRKLRRSAPPRRSAAPSPAGPAARPTNGRSEKLVTGIQMSSSAPRMVTPSGATPISSSVSRSAVASRDASASSTAPPGSDTSPAWSRRAALRTVSGSRSSPSGPG